MIFYQPNTTEIKGNANTCCALGNACGRHNLVYFCYWFILGLGSQLQVLFSLSISEILILCCAPFVLKSELPHMRRHGVLMFFYMALFLFLGCIVSLIVNHAASYQVLRGLAITGILVCSVIIAYHMLRIDPNGVKWYFIGAMLSTFICIFIFKRSVEVAMVGGTDVDSIVSGPLFWIERLTALFYTPAMAFYLRMPLAYSAGIPIFFTVFSMLISESGRSAALGALGTAAVVLIGRKKRESIQAMGRHFVLVSCIAVLGIFAAKSAYQWAAYNNYLGEKARAKYERQSAGGTSIVRLLIGGRAGSFVGLLAIADSPIWGKGYWAPDTENYYETFLSKYGNPVDYEQYINRKMAFAEKGIDIRASKMISCHSHITSFWLWFGLPGLLFWMYVLYVVFRYLRYDAYAVPQWFFWLAAGVPGFMWSLFFSPFNSRVGLPLWVVGMLMARAVRQGKYRLPESMVTEIEKSERLS
jgi:hypothetical protein